MVVRVRRARAGSGRRGLVVGSVILLGYATMGARLRGGSRAPEPGQTSVDDVAMSTSSWWVAQPDEDETCKPCIQKTGTGECNLIEMMAAADVQAAFPNITDGIGTDFGGVAASSTGRFFVVNLTTVTQPQGTDTVSTIAEITSFDKQAKDKGKAITFVAASRSPLLVLPSDIAIGAEVDDINGIEWMYVANQGASYGYGNLLRINIATAEIDTTWQPDLVAAARGVPSGPGLSQCVAVGGGHIYVLMGGTGVSGDVYQVSMDGKQVRHHASIPEATGSPNSMTANSNGELYIASKRNSDSPGGLTFCNVQGTCETRFDPIHFDGDEPSGVATDAVDNIYVITATNFSMYLITVQQTLKEFTHVSKATLAGRPHLSVDPVETQIYLSSNKAAYYVPPNLPKEAPTLTVPPGSSEDTSATVTIAPPEPSTLNGCDMSHFEIRLHDTTADDPDHDSKYPHLPKSDTQNHSVYVSWNLTRGNKQLIINDGSSSSNIFGAKLVPCREYTIEARLNNTDNYFSPWSAAIRISTAGAPPLPVQAVNSAQLVDASGRLANVSFKHPSNAGDCKMTYTVTSDPPRPSPDAGTTGMDFPITVNRLLHCGKYKFTVVAADSRGRRSNASEPSQEVELSPPWHPEAPDATVVAAKFSTRICQAQEDMTKGCVEDFIGDAITITPPKTMENCSYYFGAQSTDSSHDLQTHYLELKQQSRHGEDVNVTVQGTPTPCRTYSFVAKAYLENGINWQANASQPSITSTGSMQMTHPPKPPRQTIKAADAVPGPAKGPFSFEVSFDQTINRVRKGDCDYSYTVTARSADNDVRNGTSTTPPVKVTGLSQECQNYNFSVTAQALQPADPKDKSTASAVSNEVMNKTQTYPVPPLWPYAKMDNRSYGEVTLDFDITKQGVECGFEYSARLTSLTCVDKDTTDSTLCEKFESLPAPKNCTTDCSPPWRTIPAKTLPTSQSLHGSIDIGGLSQCTDYVYQLYSFNDVNSDYVPSVSQGADFTTLQSRFNQVFTPKVPGNDADPVMVPEDGKVKAVFKAPKDMDGCHYTFHAIDDTNKTLNATSTETLTNGSFALTVPKLRNGVEYQFGIRACHHRTGCSDMTKIQPVRPCGSFDSDILDHWSEETNLTATPYDKKVVLSFSHIGNAPLCGQCEPRYVAYAYDTNGTLLHNHSMYAEKESPGKWFSDGDNETDSCSSDLCHITFPGLQNGVSLKFTVAVDNSVYNKNSSMTTRATTPCAPPDLPNARWRADDASIKFEAPQFLPKQACGTDEEQQEWKYNVTVVPLHGVPLPSKNFPRLQKEKTAHYINNLINGQHYTVFTQIVAPAGKSKNQSVNLQPCGHFDPDFKLDPIATNNGTSVYISFNLPSLVQSGNCSVVEADAFSHPDSKPQTIAAQDSDESITQNTFKYERLTTGQDYSFTVIMRNHLFETTQEKSNSVAVQGKHHVSAYIVVIAVIGTLVLGAAALALRERAKKRHQAEIQAEAKKRVAAIAWTDRGPERIAKDSSAVVQRATAGGSAAGTKDDVNTPLLVDYDGKDAEHKLRATTILQARPQTKGRRLPAPEQTAKAIPRPAQNHTTTAPLPLGCDAEASAMSFDPIDAPVRTTASGSDDRAQRRLLKRQQRKEKQRRLLMAQQRQRAVAEREQAARTILTTAESVGDLDDWECGELDDAGQGAARAKTPAADELDDWESSAGSENVCGAVAAAVKPSDDSGDDWDQPGVSATSPTAVNEAEDDASDEWDQSAAAVQATLPSSSASTRRKVRRSVHERMKARGIAKVSSTGSLSSLASGGTSPPSAVSLRERSPIAATGEEYSLTALVEEDGTGNDLDDWDADTGASAFSASDDANVPQVATSAAEKQRDDALRRREKAALKKRHDRHKQLEQRQETALLKRLLEKDKSNAFVPYDPYGQREDTVFEAVIQKVGYDENSLNFVKQHEFAPCRVSKANRQARRQGIRVGDIVLQVEEKQVMETSTPEWLDNIFSVAGRTKLIVVFDRDSADLTKRRSMIGGGQQEAQV